MMGICISYTLFGIDAHYSIHHQNVDLVLEKSQPITILMSIQSGREILFEKVNYKIYGIDKFRIQSIPVKAFIWCTMLILSFGAHTYSIWSQVPANKVHYALKYFYFSLVTLHISC